MKYSHTHAQNDQGSRPKYQRTKEPIAIKRAITFQILIQTDILRIFIYVFIYTYIYI